MHTITKPGSVIAGIELKSTPYRNDSIVVLLKESTDSLLLEKITAGLQAMGEGFSHGHQGMVCLIEYNKSRELVDYLFQNQQISELDIATLEDDIRKIEANLDYKTRTSADISQAQYNAIGAQALPFVEYVVSFSDDHRAVLKLLQYPFSRFFERKMVSIQEFLEAAGKPSKECKTVLESLKYLKSICWGEAGLEESYKVLGTQVPNLKKQRVIVMDVMLEYLSTKFNKLSIEERFYLAGELLLMTEQFQYATTAYTSKDLLDKIFEGKIKKSDMRTYFVDFGGVYSFLAEAARKAKLTQEEKQFLISEKHSDILQESIGVVSSSSGLSMGAAAGPSTHGMFSGNSSDKTEKGEAPEEGLGHWNEKVL